MEATDEDTETSLRVAEEWALSETDIRAKAKEDFIQAGVSEENASVAAELIQAGMEGMADISGTTPLQEYEDFNLAVYNDSEALKSDAEEKKVPMSPEQVENLEPLSEEEERYVRSLIKQQEQEKQAQQKKRSFERQEDVFSLNPIEGDTYLQVIKNIHKLDKERLAFERKDIHQDILARGKEKVKAVQINRFFADKKTGKEITDKEVIKALDKSVKTNKNGVRVLENDNGETVTLSNKSLGEMLAVWGSSDNIGGIVNKEAIANLPVLFKSAVKIKETPDERHHTDNKIIRYANVFESNGEQVMVKITVKQFKENRRQLTDIEFENNGKRDLSAYSLKTAKKNTVADALKESPEGKTEIRPLGNNNGTDIIIDDLIDYVNSYSAETIKINGKERSARNSQGERIAKTEEGLRAFYEWFGNSKVVDENGRPLVVYHRTDADFDTFDKSKQKRGFYGQGFYFSNDDEFTRHYGKNTMPVYLSIKKPIEGVSSTELRNNLERYKQQGYDGTIHRYDDGTITYSVFEPNQIKSVYNRGSFDNNNPNIYYQRGRGYIGYSMSVNMADAQANNELPASKAAKALGVSVQAVREVLSPSAWHHASSYYNKVNVYDINPYLELKAGKELSEYKYTKEEIQEYKENWEEMKSFPKPEKNVKEYYGDAKWIEWEGTRAHPKAIEHEETGILIREKGSFYTFHLKNGEEIRKKIGSNGTEVVSEEEKAKRERLSELRKLKEQKLSEIRKTYREEFEKYRKENKLDKPDIETFEKVNTERNASGENIYISGQKPTSEYKEVGLRRIHSEPLGKTYQLEEWDGEKWKVLEKREGELKRNWTSEISDNFDLYVSRKDALYRKLDAAWDIEELEQVLREADRYISGEELGEYKDANDLRKKAYKYFKDNLQGKYAEHPVLGKIKFIRKGIDKVKSTSADIDKLKLLPKIKEIIETAELIRSQENEKPEKSDIIRFHYLANNVILSGKPIDVFVTVAEDRDGNFFYNINKDNKTPSRVGAKQRRTDEGKADNSALNLTITPVEENVKRGEGSFYRQEEKEVLSAQNQVRGYFEMGNKSGQIIHILKHGDVDTMVHELMHFFTLNRIERAQKAGKENLLQGIMRYYHVTNSEELMRQDIAEDLADKAMVYLTKEEAPTSYMRRFFETFKRWLERFKAALVKNGVIAQEELSPEIKEFFDKMFSVEAKRISLEQIKGQEQQIRDTLKKALKGEAVSFETREGEQIDIRKVRELLSVQNKRLPKKPQTLAQKIRKKGGINKKLAAKFDWLISSGAKDTVGNNSLLIKKREKNSRSFYVIKKRFNNDLWIFQKQDRPKKYLCSALYIERPLFLV